MHAGPGFVSNQLVIDSNVTASYIYGMYSTINKLISDLGGAAAVADHLGIGVPAVRMWRKRGVIPWRWHQTIREMGESKGVKMPERVFIRETV